MASKHRFTVSENLAKLPGPAGERFIEVFSHGIFLADIYAPRGTDPYSNPNSNFKSAIASARS